MLVRLRVEHSGFSTINNQRFGARFVGDVANPSDMLLFHRKKRPTDASGGSSRNSKKKAARALAEPVMEDPEQELTVEELIKDNLITGERKMEVGRLRRLFIFYFIFYFIFFLLQKRQFSALCIAPAPHDLAAFSTRSHTFNFLVPCPSSFFV